MRKTETYAVISITLFLAGCYGLTAPPADDGAATFLVRVENVSTAETLAPSDGSMQAVPLSPGVWVVHQELAPLFSAGEPDRDEGLEAIAEDGSPAALAAALDVQESAQSSAAFDTPAGATEAGPIGPGGAYEFTITAEPGARLSVATMFVPSNDLFYSPSAEGIPLFDSSGAPVGGDVTDQISLWDAGTEVNEEPGVGGDQVQRQDGPNTGADEDGVVQLVDDGFSYPATGDVIRVTITPQE